MAISVTTDRAAHVAVGDRVTVLAEKAAGAFRGVLVGWDGEDQPPARASVALDAAATRPVSGQVWVTVASGDGSLTVFAGRAEPEGRAELVLDLREEVGRESRRAAVRSNLTLPALLVLGGGAVCGGLTEDVSASGAAVRLLPGGSTAALPVERERVELLVDLGVGSAERLEAQVVRREDAADGSGLVALRFTDVRDPALDRVDRVVLAHRYGTDIHAGS